MSARRRGSLRLRLAVTALLLPLAALLGVAPAHAADTDVDGVTYELADPADATLGAIAVGYTEADNADHPHLTIADQVTIDGQDVPVTSVGFQAFRAVGLESVEMPQTLTSIETSAFAHNRLTSVDLPAALTSIGSYAFTRNDLTGLDLGHLSGLTHVAISAFSANEIATLSLPDSLTTIEAGAFWFNELTEVVIPGGVTVIEEEAFATNSLSEVTIPASVTELGAAVFAENPQLRTVVFAGPAPLAGTDPFSGPQEQSEVTVEFPWRYGAEQAGEGGFPSPTWFGHRTVPVIEVVTVDPTGVVPMPAPFSLALDQVTDGGPAATVPADVLPDPVHPEREFAGWSADDAATPGGPTPWAPGDLLFGDTTLTALWALPPASLASIEVRASATTVDEGETVTLTAEGFDDEGVSLGDVTAETVFTSDVATDEVDADQVTFPTASDHTITGTHASGVSDAVVIEVIPAATGPQPTEPTVEPATPGVPEGPPTATTGTLAETGTDGHLLVAMVTLVSLGSLVVLLAQRGMRRSLR
ncbi:leucine-rich repeat protein [Ruania suaedae]|uniref:leucine-rich repeat domain-containing protein n=1 Tax=Ruania suaedae TaxID=2897774 RepID=UPI001E46CBB0|nr:leucine-rich repeat domain-containing protein [Ruania suaedae]UFU03752.1 leucine-rich repeat protein [Ruania suaedae]